MKLNPEIHTWLTDPRIAQILAALPAGSTRFVGGCVRNAILGVPIGDIDLATQLEPKDVQAKLKSAKIKTVPTGIDHGTLTAVIDGTPYEITSLRKDVETDGRRAVVAFTQDWAEDAIRRDLTMNALYADATGKVFDPTEQGLDDIQARRFRFVGDADARVREDYLRILRFFRFLAFYGDKSKIDAEALKACRENRAGLKSLSAERVWSEMKKLLSASSPIRSLRIMLTNEILETVFPEASNVEGVDLLCQLETEHNISPDPIRRLMALSARDEFAMASFAKRLKLSNSEKARLLGWASDRTSLAPNMDEKSMKVATYMAGSQVIIDRATLRAAGAGNADHVSGWLALAAFARHWSAPDFPLKGRDIQAAGIEDGPRIGKTLEALKALWIKSGFTADKDRLLMALSLIAGQATKTD